MVRSVASKVMWVGRATVFLVGLAVIMALVLGAASMALGADGKPFILGKKNTATKVSKLVKSGVGPALSLKVGSGPPLQVNSSDTVTNLSSDKLDGKEPGQLPGSIASVATIHDFPGMPFDLGKSSTGFKFVGAPAQNITTTASQRLVGAAGVPMSDPTPTSFIYDLCYRPSGGGTITPFTGNATGTLHPTADVVWTATSSAVPGAGTWDVGFCIRSAVNDTRDAERISYVNGWVMVVNQ